VCKTCAENLRERFEGIRSSVPFGIPMVWHEAQNHYNDCCFCGVQYLGTTTKQEGHSVSMSVIGRNKCAPLTRHPNSYTTVITD
jgi:hypothetical protein